MRTVLPTQRHVAHAFLIRKQHTARTSNRSFYFEGPVLYSDGKHFVVARFLPDGRLFTSLRRDSLSTNGHCQSLRGALWELNRLLPGQDARTKGRIKGFDVYDAAKSPEEEILFRVQQVAEAQAEIIKRIRRPSDAVKWFNRWEVYKWHASDQANLLGLPIPHISELPDELVQLKAICVMRGYKV